MNAIEISNLTKIYRLYRSPRDRVREFFNPLGKKYHSEFYALDNVSFSVKKGQTVGVIGRNGSGKSTLLKIVCGVVQPTLGKVTTNGRISSLLELGTGFNPEFTGRENVYMNSALLGLKRDEIEKNIPNIEDFSEIGAFIDQPVRSYSSGMFVRLAFATAINVEPEILIIDEALSVGDAKFQRKCFSKIEQLKKEGKTILYVSHQMKTVNFLCDKVVLLDKGVILGEGDTRTVVNLYHQVLFKEEIQQNSIEKGTTKKVEEIKDKGSLTFQNEVPSKIMHPKHKKVEIINGGILNGFGEKVIVAETGKKYSFYLVALYHENIEEMVAGIGIKNVSGLVISSASTFNNNINIGPKKYGSLLEITFTMELFLCPGEYFADFVLRKSMDSEFYDIRYDFLHFRVSPKGNRKFYWGLVNLPSYINVKDLTMETKDQ